MDRKRLSYSAISTWQECKQKYHHSYIKKLELKTLYVPYLIGRVFQYGLLHIFKKIKDPIKPAIEYFTSEVKRCRKEFSVSKEQEQDLKEQEIIIKGMLTAYKNHYSNFLKDVEFVQSEKEIKLEIGDNLLLKQKIDHLIFVKGKLYIHELKTTNGITPDYIKAIQNNLQVAGYLHGYNIQNPKDPIAGILFDIIKKPTIRQKKAESYRQYLERLFQWYEEKPAAEVFHQEIITKPIITKNMFLQVVNGVGNEIVNAKKEEDYFPNFKSCNNYGRCEFWDLCFMGNSKLVMANYKERTYHEAPKPKN